MSASWIKRRCGHWPGPKSEPPHGAPWPLSPRLERPLCSEISRVIPGNFVPCLLCDTGKSFRRVELRNEGAKAIPTAALDGSLTCRVTWGMATSWLGPGEDDERAGVVPVGGPEGIEVRLPQRFRRVAAVCAPAERWPAEGASEVVAADAAVAAVPVHERVDPHQPVMEPQSEFVRLERGELRPRPPVSDELAHHHGDVKGVDA